MSSICGLRQQILLMKRSKTCVLVIRADGPPPVPFRTRQLSPPAPMVLHGRLVGLGVRQSRFFGRAKTQFQALMAAAVANFTLLAGWMASQGGADGFGGRMGAALMSHRPLQR